MEKSLPSPPGSTSFRHLPSRGSWIVSATLAREDQVLRQMTSLAPAAVEAESLGFVSSTLMIDGVEAESRLH